MSHWTHITACLSVDTGIQDKRIKSIVRKYINKAPKITGSERDADIFINVQKGHNIWISKDCNRCPYKDTKDTIGELRW